MGNGVSRVTPLPYEIKADVDAVRVCFPNKVVTDIYVLNAFLDNLIFGANGGLGTRKVVAFDDLSVTIRYSNGGSSMELPLVRGMPYVTLFYDNMMPTITTIHAIMKINGEQAQPGTEFTGEKFTFEMNNEQTWNLYVSQSVKLLYTGQGFNFEENFSGYVRVAIGGDAARTSALDNFVDNIPIGKNHIRKRLSCLGRS